jgi:hypothetical protein
MEREVLGEVGHQPPDARLQVVFLVADRDDNLHLREAAGPRLWKLLTRQALK